MNPIWWLVVERSTAEGCGGESEIEAVNADARRMGRLHWEAAPPPRSPFSARDQGVGVHALHGGRQALCRRLSLCRLPIPRPQEASRRPKDPDPATSGNEGLARHLAKGLDADLAEGGCVRPSRPRVARSRARGLHARVQQLAHQRRDKRWSSEHAWRPETIGAAAALNSAAGAAGPSPLRPRRRATAARLRAAASRLGVGATWGLTRAYTGSGSPARAK